nr:TetR/AcrR family transcriptional regulator [Ardenticatenales bacterium]
MNERKQLSKREQILDAARRVVQQQGVHQLTLDAVAAEAGVSKGGLLYHFASKEALIAAMLAHFLDTFDAEVQEVYATAPEQRGRWLRAYVHVSFRSADYHPSFIAAVLAAVASHPLLLAALQEQYRQWQQHAMEDGVSLQTTLLVM